MKNKIKVLFISLIMPDYKVHVFSELIKNNDIHFLPFHGHEGKNILPKDIGRGILLREVYINNLYIKSKSEVYIAFQCVFKNIFRFNPDVIILQDGVKIVSNYIICLYAYIFGKKIVWYTHGENRQSKNKLGLSSRIIEKIRLWYLKRSHAIIAYSHDVKFRLKNQGVNDEKIFIALNTLNVESIIHKRKNLTEHDIKELRAKYFPGQRRIITFIGRLIPMKKVEYFISLFEVLQAKGCCDILGVVIGSGYNEEEYKTQVKEKNIKNIYFLGQKSVDDAVEYLIASDLVFIPGATGLAIVHSFASGTPYVTLNVDIHGPEIEYLQNNHNGLITTQETFINDIIDLIEDEERLQNMKREALKTAENELQSSKQIQGFLEAISYAYKN